MVPDYRIHADGVDITATIQRLLISLEIIDKAGIESDALTITLDDRETVAIPRTGAELSLSLGYRESGLVDAGRWVVNEVEIATPPARMTIRARAANLTTTSTTSGIPHTLRSCKTRSWEQISLGGIARAIAAEHGLIAAVDAIYDAGTPPSIGALIPFVAQLDESDMHMMTRLAHAAGARFRIVEGRLLLTPEAAAVSASGRTLAAPILTPTQLTSYHATISERTYYAAAIASWHDPNSAQMQQVHVGVTDGEPLLRISGTQRSEQAARAVAIARLASANRGRIQWRAYMPGQASLRAGMPITLQSFRDGLNGSYSITELRHAITSAGFISTIQAEAA